MSRTSRRALLRASGAAVAAIGLDSCGAADKLRQQLHGTPPPQRSADIRILNHLLDLVNRSGAAYTAGIPLLSGAAARNAEQFLGQELSHAGELAGLVKDAGAVPIKQRTGYGLGSPGSPGQVLALLHELEAGLIAAFLDAIPRLAPGSVRAAVVTILANDAQHLSFIRGALHLDPLPAPLVSGAP